MQSVQWMILLLADLIYVVDPKMIVNNHLLVSYGLQNSIARYQCLTPTSQMPQRIQLSLSNSSPRSLAIGKKQTESQLYFVVFGAIGQSGIYHAFYMTKVTVHCENSTLSGQHTVLFDNTTFDETFTFAFAVSPDGRFALSPTTTSLLIFDLNTLQNSSCKINFTRLFRPKAITITNRHVFIAGYTETAVEGRMLYLLTFNFTNSTNYRVTIADVWTGVGKTNMLSNFALSVTLEATPRILLVVSQPSTIHLLNVNESDKLYYISSDMRFEVYSAEWMNDGEKAVIRTKAQNFFVFNMKENARLDNSTMPSSQFLTSEQSYTQLAPSNIEDGTSTLKNSDLYLENRLGNVIIIPASRPGYYSVPNLLLTGGWILSYIANSAQCPIRTYKNESGFSSCIRCQSLGNISNIDSISPTCPQCTKKEYCPGEFITSLDQFEDITQNVGYPESPEVDVFDELILYNMFRADCGITSPLSLTMIALSIVILFSILVLLIKHIERFGRIRKHLLLGFRHLDLIGQGELWFGGLVTIAVFFLIGFASQFSHLYYEQYPIEKQQQQQIHSENSCNFHELLNSKFETTLQFLSIPSDEHKEIFYLLDSQSFILYMELIQTQYHCEQLRLEYIEKQINLAFTCEQDSGVLYVSTNLPVHQMSVNVVFYGNHTTRSVRFGLSSKSLHLNKNTARQLNFSKRFNSSHTHRLSKNARIHLDLTKIINITEGLTENDNTTIDGLWLPTFTFDIDQMFVNTNIAFSSSNDRSMERQSPSSTLSISIRETAFFVKNKQKPIARRFEIIFHTFLFIGVCLDLLVMIFVLLKLWLVPLIKFLLKNFLTHTHWLYRIIFHEDHNDVTHDISSDMIRLETEVNILKLKVQETNDIMQTFIRNTSFNNRSSTRV